MGISTILFVFNILCRMLICLKVTDVANDISVLDYGAAGDGIHDDSKAFLKTWDVACHKRNGVSSILIPQGKTFLLSPIIFEGSCKAKAVNFKVFGTIKAPQDPRIWYKTDNSTWLTFSNVNGLHVSGNGEIDGQGFKWWKQSCKYHVKPCTKTAPTAIRFIDCTEGDLTGISIVNSPQCHVLVWGCTTFHISNVTIKSPGDSPNTDGIHLQSSEHVQIYDSIIGAGDDCISIGDEISDISIGRINCGPGHGISIGSLGKDGRSSKVRDVHVFDVSFSGTTNGARIKTWPGGKGYVQGVTFKKLTFNAVKNPIVIDQFYCFRDDDCKKAKTGVHISNVTYEDALGTSQTQIAINLNCSNVVACTDINFVSVNLTSVSQGQKVSSHCKNADIDTEGPVQPKIACR